jgi:hypothetical protein
LGFRTRSVLITFVVVSAAGGVGLLLDSLYNWPFLLETGPWVLPHRFASGRVSWLSILFFFANVPAFAVAWGIARSLFLDFDTAVFKIASVVLGCVSVYLQWLSIDRVVALILRKDS